MKPSTIFLAEMTNPEVEAFLKDNNTVIIPVGAMEQHGLAGPISTDVLIPQEVARRVAPRTGALVAPPLSYALSYPHKGFTGVFSLSITTFMSLIEDLCLTFSEAGFRRIIFLNGHFDNTFAIAYGCANAAEKLPEGCRAFPINYWDGLSPEQTAQYYGSEKGLHANATETSAVLAINPDLVDMERANTELPNFPPVKVPSAPIHTAFFLTAPGSVWRITESGTWGDADHATVEMGKTFLEAVTTATLDLIKDIEKTFRLLPRR
jgi:creatinine amidohydrolase